MEAASHRAAGPPAAPSRPLRPGLADGPGGHAPELPGAPPHRAPARRRALATASPASLPIFLLVILLVAAGGCASLSGAEAPGSSEAAAAAEEGEAGAAWEAGGSPFPSTYEPLPSPPTLIRGATVLTGTGERIDGGSVLLVDGEVAAVGRDLEAPAGARVIEAKGRWVTPGIIDVHSHLGVYPSPSVDALSDGNEATDPVTAQVWAEHSVWPQDPGFVTALAGGITSLHVLPGSANLIGGRGVTLKNVPSRTVQGMKFPGAPYSLKMACGENPKRVYGGRGRAPSTRMGNVAGYRAAWIDAQEYRRRWERWAEEGRKPEDRPERDLALETLVGVLEGEILVHNHCYRADEMAQMLDVAREFGYEVTAFHHAVEAYKIADLLADNGVCAALWSDWWGFKVEAYDGIRENVALVDRPEGGCAIVHSDSEQGIQRLNQEAAKSMAAGRRAGLEIAPEHAVRWITAHAARALGVADRTGTLEPGKMGDVVVWSGDPFSVYARADQVFVDGALVWDRNDPAHQPEMDFSLGLLPASPAGPDAASQHRTGTMEEKAAARAAAPPTAAPRAVEAAAAVPVETPPEAPPPAARAAAEGGAAAAVAAAEAPPSAVALVGGTVHTRGEAGILYEATVVLEDGRITGVGVGLEPPAGARVIDVRGRVVTPGLLDSFSQIGLVEVGQVEGSRDTATDDDRITASFRVGDALNPHSTLVPVNRVEGLTRALVVPSPGDDALIAGQAALVHLGGDRVPGGTAAGEGDDAPIHPMLVREPAALFAVLGEAGADRAGGSRGAALVILREALDDALDYAGNRDAFARGERRSYALSRLDLEALVPAVTGPREERVPLLVRAERASDLLAAVRLADEYGLRLVVAGAAEGWMVADELAAAGVPVLLQPLGNLPSSFESLGATLQNAARLHRAGVPVAVMSGDSHNARNLRQAAGNAVAHGLPWEAGLAAMTDVPAAIWGLDGSYGRLAPGYDADVVVWNGDPLEVTSFPEHVFIRGVEMPDETRQTRLRDRYLELPEEGERPPAYRRP